MSERLEQHKLNNNKILTVDDQEQIISLYGRGFDPDYIAEKLGFTKNQTRRVIDSWEKSRKPPEELEKAYYRAPQISTIIDPKTGKTYYDVTEFFLDVPCICSIKK